MNKKNRILILLGVLAVLVIAAVGVSMYTEKQEQIATTEETILAVATEDVTAVSWEFENEDADTDDGEAGSGSFSFTLTDDTWVYDDDEAFPVSTEEIEALLEIFNDFGAAFIIEEVEDYSQYGLSNPCAEITLTTEDAEYVIELGDFSSLDEQRYVSVGDGNVYLVSVDPMEYYAVNLSDLVQNDETPDFDLASLIEIEGEESYTITYEEESSYAYSEDDVYFTELSGSTLVLDASAVKSYVSKIESVGLTDYVTYNATDEELTEYGFDDPELVVTIEYTETVTDSETGDETEESGTFVITVARDADQIAAAEEEAAAEETDEDEEDEEDEDDDGYAAYVRIGDSPILYGIDSDDYEYLMAYTYLDLCHQEVMPFDVTEITEAEITISDDETYTLTAETDEDGNQTWYYDEEEIDGTDFTDALSGLTAIELTDDDDADDAEITLTLTLDNENYSEIEIILYRYNGENCLAVVNGEPFAYVSRSDTMALVETVNTIVLN